MCALFGPSAAGGAYIPAFCDFVTMVEGNASMYLGSPRMAEMVIGEKATLEEMGGARLHATVRGADTTWPPTTPRPGRRRGFLSYLPGIWQEPPPAAAAAGAGADRPARAGAGQRAAGLRHAPLRGGPGRRGLAVRGHALWARELTVGFARLDGQPIGVVANNPLFKGGVLFVDSADKAARFI